MSEIERLNRELELEEVRHDEIISNLREVGEKTSNLLKASKSRISKLKNKINKLIEERYGKIQHDKKERDC